MKVGSTLKYLHSDHLGSTAVETVGSSVTASQKYCAYGKQRTVSGSTITCGSGNSLATDHTFTGQKQDGSGLMYYDARFYDPSIGTFISADTIVPSPGDSHSYNRFSYVRGNPLKFTDPSGHAPQSPDDDPNNPADCATKWCWQNRWFVAHGLGWNGKTWGNVITAIFYDSGILSDVLGEIGLTPSGNWNPSELELVGQGAVALARKVGGTGALNRLLGGSKVSIIRQDGRHSEYSALTSCSILFGCWIDFYDTAFLTTLTGSSNSAIHDRGLVVHELAHVIDLQGRFWFPRYSSGLPAGPNLGPQSQRGSDEYFSEAVRDWVYPADNEGVFGHVNDAQMGFLNVNLVSKDPHMP